MQYRFVLFAFTLTGSVLNSGKLQQAAAQTLAWSPMHEPSVGGAITDITISPFDSRRVLIGGDMLGAGLTTDGGKTWGPTFGFKSWEICSFTWHPNNSRIVWASTMSGPYLSTDSGVHWTERRTGMPEPGGNYYSCPIQRVLFDPAKSSHLWAFGGSKRRWGGGGDQARPDWNSVWESVDDGKSWTRIATVGKKINNGISAAVVSAGPAPYDLYCAVEQQGAFKSSDGGRVWSPVNTGLPALTGWDLVAHPTEKNTLYLSYDRYREGDAYKPGGIAKTTDGGAHWITRNRGLTQTAAADENQATGYHCLACSRSQPDLLVTSDYGWKSHGIFRSFDGGASWNAVVGNGTPTPVHPDHTGPGMNTLAIDHRGKIVFGGDMAVLYASRDGGNTWSDSGNTLVGDAWMGHGFAGWVTTTVKVNPYRNQIVLMSLDDGKFQSSADSGVTWQQGGKGLQPYNGGQDVTFAGPEGRTLYATFGQFDTPDGSGIARSRDGGTSWTYLAKPVGATGLPVGIHALPGTPETVWVCYGGALYRSTNGGTTAEGWLKVSGHAIEKDGGLERIVPDPQNPSTFYLTGNKGVWKTTDGKTFSCIEGSPAPVSSLTVDPVAPARLYVIKRKTGLADGLYRYDGTQWVALRSDRTVSAVAVNPANANQILLTTYDDPYNDHSYSTGVWITGDGGRTWTQKNKGLAMLRSVCIAFNPWVPGQLLLGTDGRGFYKATLPRR